MKENAVKSDTKSKSAMNASAADNAATETPAKTKEDAWKGNQQKVSKKSSNLYSVTEDPNETALTGDGYSAKNGVVKEAAALTSFFGDTSSKTIKPGDQKKLKVVEHEAPGLVLNVGSAPQLEDLVKEDENGEEANLYRGSISDPNISKDVSDKYLFADGGPNQNDVKQVGVGDCYFWGAVLQILAHDPGKFTQMMQLKGDTVETTMYYKQGKKWVAEKISRPMGIGGLNAQYEEKANKFKGRECGVRVDTGAPCESAWNAVMQNSVCMINRTDYYKAALWANCLEQAYSDFSRAHGQYGAGMNYADGSGKEEFESGCSDSCMNMFYGDKASGPKTFANNSSSTTLKALIDFKKSLESAGGYTALVARRRMGDPNSNSAHAYSVENITFCDKKGKTIDFTDNSGILGFFSDLWERYNIDTKKSKILFRNPWNSTRSDMGKFFEVNLDDFLTNGEWTHLYKATVSERAGK